MHGIYEGEKNTKENLLLCFYNNYCNLLTVTAAQHYKKTALLFLLQQWQWCQKLTCPLHVLFFMASVQNILHSEKYLAIYTQDVCSNVCKLSCKMSVTVV
jgi:hypothetical protein